MYYILVSAVIAIAYLLTRHFMSLPRSLAGFGIVYFGCWTILGGARVIAKCLSAVSGSVVLDDLDIVCICFGFIAMTWLSVESIWKQLAPPRLSQARGSASSTEASDGLVASSNASGDH